jgi:hypothetical protein
MFLVACKKFRRAGVVNGNSPFNEPGLLLYDLLCKDGSNVYGRYNALIRDLISFGQALAHLNKAAKLA